MSEGLKTPYGFNETLLYLSEKPLLIIKCLSLMNEFKNYLTQYLSRQNVDM